MSTTPMVPMKVLSWALMAMLVVNALWIAWDTTLIVHEVSLLERLEVGEFVSEAEGAVSNERREASGNGLSLIIIATVVVWLVWQYRGQRNLRRAQRPALRFSPGWAVGWWFVPFANLVNPFRTVRELWSRSDPAERSYEIRNWWVIGVWWGLWIGWIVAYSLVGDVTDATTAAELITADRWEIAGNVAFGTDAVLALVIVRAVLARQTELALAPAPVPSRPDTGMQGWVHGSPTHPPSV